MSLARLDGDVADFVFEPRRAVSGVVDAVLGSVGPVFGGERNDFGLGSLDELAGVFGHEDDFGFSPRSASKSLKKWGNEHAANGGFCSVRSGLVLFSGCGFGGLWSGLGKSNACGETEKNWKG